MAISTQRAREVFMEIKNGRHLKDADQAFLLEVFSALSRWESSLIKGRITSLLVAGERPVYLDDLRIGRVFKDVFAELSSEVANTSKSMWARDPVRWSDSSSSLATESLIEHMEKFIVPGGEPSFVQRAIFFKKIDLPLYIEIINKDLLSVIDHVSEKLSEVSALASALKSTQPDAVTVFAQSQS